MKGFDKHIQLFVGFVELGAAVAAMTIWGWQAAALVVLASLLLTFLLWLWASGRPNKPALTFLAIAVAGTIAALIVVVNRNPEPSVEIRSHSNGDKVNLTAETREDGGVNRTFVLSGVYANLPSNPPLEVYLLSANPGEEQWWVWNTTRRGEDGWQTKVIVGSASPGKPYRLMAIIADPNRVRALTPQGDNELIVTNINRQLAPEVQSEQVDVTIGNIGDQVQIVPTPTTESVVTETIIPSEPQSTPGTIPTAVTSLPIAGNCSVPVQQMVLLRDAHLAPARESADEVHFSTDGVDLGSFDVAQVKIDVHGTTLEGGDASALHLDQSDWRYASLSEHVDPIEGLQTVIIPLDQFRSNAGIVLDRTDEVGGGGVRIWTSQEDVKVDIQEIALVQC